MHEPPPANPAPVIALRGQQVYAIPPVAGPIDLRLDANEGPWPSHGATVAPALLRAYPHDDALELELAALHGVAVDAVLVTAGADEALDRVFRAYVTAGQKVVMPQPTFVMLPRYAALCGATLVSIDWQGGPFPIDAVLAAIDRDTALITIVSPNNPTGAVASRSDLLRVAAAAPTALVLVDAAYGEFADDDLTDLALTLPNAIVTRTLSKAWGLAGCRVGYALGSPATLAPLRLTASPYSVATTSRAIALARLREDRPAMTAYVATIRNQIDVLRRALTECGFEAGPSQANFVMARGPRAAFLHAGLGALGIAVRAFGGDPRLADCLRITCPGDAVAFARLLHSIESCCAPQALLFDLDGVLADVSATHRRAICLTAAHFGVVVDDAQVLERKARGDANDDRLLTITILRDAKITVPDDDVRAKFDALYEGEAGAPGLWREETPLITRASLALFAARLPLAIVTGRPRADTERMLAHFGWHDLFAAIVCREDAPSRKPDRAPVARALAMLAVTRAWMLGDTPDDVHAARGAGVLPIGIAPGDSESTAGTAMLDALRRAGVARILPRAADALHLLP